MTDYIGRQFGNYTLTRLLGKGGFAEVYLGEHIYLKSLAAIKILLTSLGTEEMAYFRAEAHTLAALKHPHIVRILDFGIEGDIPFIVMEYAPNGTMQQRYPRGVALAPGVVVPYVKQIASALQYAHNQKLIHRDIKSGNMLLQENDELLLSDFGVAMFAQSTRQPSQQVFVGTATYMAPEQIRGKACQASDQYALGVVVYEWLSGGALFQGAFTEVCAQHMYAPPEPLRSRIPTLSPEIEQVVMTALAKEPDQRFASVEAFADALKEAYYSSDTEPVALDLEASPTQIDADNISQQATRPEIQPEDLIATQISSDTRSDSRSEEQEGAITEPDPTAPVQQHSLLSNSWVPLTSNQVFGRMRQISPRGVLVLVVLVAVLLSGSGLLYMAYAKTDRPASAQNRAVATQQSPAQATQTGSALQTATPTQAHTTTSRQVGVGVATPTPVSYPAPTSTAEPVATATPTPEAGTGTPTPAPTPTSAPKPTPTPKPVCPPMIQSGSTGTWVKTLQKDLNARGMTDSSGKALVVDGDFGANTQYAVKSWQKKAGIGVDGQVGPQTWHSLGRC